MLIYVCAYIHIYIYIYTFSPRSDDKLAESRSQAPCWDIGLQTVLSQRPPPLLVLCGPNHLPRRHITHEELCPCVWEPPANPLTCRRGSCACRSQGQTRYECGRTRGPRGVLSQASTPSTDRPTDRPIDRRICIDVNRQGGCARALARALSGLLAGPRGAVSVARPPGAIRVLAGGRRPGGGR